MNIRKNLSLLAIIFLLVSCGQQQSTRLRYEAEKLHFKANKEFSAAQFQGLLSDKTTATKLVNKFNELYQFCSTSLDSLGLSALLESKETIEIQSIAFEATTRLTQLYYADRNYDTCVVVLNRFLTEIPARGSHLLNCLLNLGQAVHAAGDWDSAQAVYKTALATFYPPLSGSGKVEYRLFNLPYHIVSVTSRSSDSTATEIVHQEAVTYYSRLSETAAAQSELQSACHANLAILFDDAGQYQQAIEQLGLITTQEKVDKIPLLIRIGNTYANNLDDIDKAIEIYQSAANLAGPKDTLMYPLAKFREAGALMIKKQPAEARVILNQLKRDHRSFYDRNAGLLAMMAETFEKENNWDRAETEYNLLVEKFPESPESFRSYLHIIDRYSKLGNTKEANRWREDATALANRIIDRRGSGPTSAGAIVFLADLLRQSGQFEPAAEQLVLFYNRYPGSPPAQRALAAAIEIYDIELGQGIIADSLRRLLVNDLSKIGSGQNSGDQLLP